MDYSDLILDLMTIFSFIVSAILGTIQIIQSRRKVKIEVIDYHKIWNISHFFVFIHNCSNKPISISSICIRKSDKEIRCELIPKKIIKTNEKLITTPAFPLNLNPRESLSYYLEFLDCEGISLKKENLLSLAIYTNRGKTNIDLYLPDKSGYLHKKQWNEYRFL